MQQIGEKITLFLLSFYFSNMMPNVQVIAAIALLLDNEDEKRRMSKSALSGFDHGLQEENLMEHFTPYFKS